MAPPTRKLCRAAGAPWRIGLLLVAGAALDLRACAWPSATASTRGYASCRQRQCGEGRPATSPSPERDSSGDELPQKKRMAHLRSRSVRQSNVLYGIVAFEERSKVSKIECRPLLLVFYTTPGPFLPMHWRGSDPTPPSDPTPLVGGRGPTGPTPLSDPTPPLARARVTRYSEPINYGTQKI